MQTHDHRVLPEFTAVKGGNTLTYRFLMEGDRPLKLGDGTFGSVFAVEDADRNRYAVKVFYHTDDQEARNSFRKEMQATQEINAALQQAGRETTLANLVLPIARTESFLASAAARCLEGYFKETNLSISDYAFVMERYECTLKDLLEKGRCDSHAPGYERLRSLPLARREEFVLWIASEIATALRALHIARLHHHDLKPANILLRERGTRLEAGLADLGFLEPNRVFGTQNIGPSSLLPIGTRHYRAPEHKDYFDVCEVLITESTARQDVLETYDPKFRDTLIERNDMLMYCKDPKKVLRRILEVRSEPGGRTCITVERANQPMLTREKTQVVMYKHHTARTDGFGLGAIMYDILTCGDSPERFYDHFRYWDNPKGSVQKLILGYKQFHAWQSATADVVSGFELLRAKEAAYKGYPSPAVVGVLFRLLLPRATGSYFARSDPNAAGAAFERILSDLSRLVTGQQTTGEEPVQSVLWRGDSSPSPQTAPEAETFEARLIRVQAQADPRARLAHGYRLFERLAMSIIDHLDESDCDLPYVAEMSPRNIRVLSSSTERPFHVRSGYTTFEKFEDYKRALQDGDLNNIELVLRGQLPLAYRFLSREAVLIVGSTGRKALPPAAEPAGGPLDSTFEVEVEVELELDDEAEGQSVGATESSTREIMTTDVSFFFCGGSPFWSEIECGDHVILDLDAPRLRDAPRRVVGSVLHVYGGNSMRIAYERPRGFAPWNGEPKRVHLAKKFRKTDYYLAVIASYIQQIFFVDNKLSHGSIPQEVYLVEQLVTTGQVDPAGNSALLDARLRPSPTSGLLAPLITRLRRALSPSRGVDVDVMDCYSYMAELYLWLNCRFFRRGPRATLGDIEHVQEVRRHIERLGDTIAPACGFRDRTALLLNAHRELPAPHRARVGPEPDLEALLREIPQRLRRPGSGAARGAPSRHALSESATK